MSRPFRFRPTMRALGTAAWLVLACAQAQGQAGPAASTVADGTPKASAPAPVGPAVGTVKRVEGKAMLRRGEQEWPLIVGTRLQPGDVLFTDATGRASITLADDTLLSAGPSTELVISQFSFDPTTQQGNMLVSVWRGLVSVVTGLIARRSPEQVQFQTRTVVLGVRGTEFIIEAGAPAP